MLKLHPEKKTSLLHTGKNPIQIALLQLIVSLKSRNLTT